MTIVAHIWAMQIRVGFGYDVHRLSQDRELWLGGVLVPSDKGALGHSDADVLLHAICDALLGAANLRDIGFHFPDTGDTWKNADSKVLLRRTVELLRAGHWEIGNIDCTLVLEKPKIASYREAMVAAIAENASVDISQVSIKATTSEGMGFVGTREGLAAYAVVLIQRH